MTLATTFLCLGSVLVPGGPEWLTDFAKAKAQAAAEGKDLLIDFTGSDWCGWCIKLKEEVFATDAFGAGIGEHFVLVEIDFPRKQPLPKELREQNLQLQREFGVQGFPTIILADARGKPYAQTGYRRGGPEAYLQHLAEQRAVRATRDAAWAKAEDAEGASRAALLAEGLSAMSQELHGHYRDVVQRIVELDADGSAGLREVWAARLAQLEQAAKVAEVLAEAERSAEAGDWAAVAKRVSGFVAEQELEPEQAQALYAVLLHAQEETEDFRGAVATARKLKELLPRAAGQIDAMIVELEKRAAGKTDQAPAEAEAGGVRR